MNALAFNEILEAAEKLSLEEQETLVDILHKRLMQQRRAEILRDAEEAEREFQQGTCRPFTPGALTRELGL
jgi:hypothetical protein